MRHTHCQNPASARSCRTFLFCVVMFVAGSVADACSIPVFRYALERWPADLFEVDVFYRDTLSAEHRQLVSQLEDQSLVNGGGVNWEVVLCRVEDDLAQDLQTVRESLGDVSYPHLVLRRPGGRQGSPIVWQGPLQDAQRGLWTSPARSALIDRLATGDSIVWLVFRGKSREQAQHATALLQENFPTLSDEIALPPGVGLPGSEVLSPVPLAVRFSVLEIDDASETERLFRREVLSGHPQAMGEGETIVVPVFGRGRAMAVLSADEFDAATVEEYTRFLCGACSCQVKQGNPGFDLLLAVNWDERLWSDGEPPQRIPATAGGDAATETTMVAIPPGQPPASPANASPDPNSTSVLTIAQSTLPAWIVAVIGLVVFGLVFRLCLPAS